AVSRDEVRRLIELVEIDLAPFGSGLLAGLFQAEVRAAGGAVFSARLLFPPGAPQRPMSAKDFETKRLECVGGLEIDESAWSWQGAPAVLQEHLPACAPATGGRWK